MRFLLIGLIVATFFGVVWFLFNNQWGPAIGCLVIEFVLITLIKNIE